MQRGFEATGDEADGDPLAAPMPASAATTLALALALGVTLALAVTLAAPVALPAAGPPEGGAGSLQPTANATHQSRRMPGGERGPAPDATRKSSRDPPNSFAHGCKAGVLHSCKNKIALPAAAAP